MRTDGDESEKSRVDELPNNYKSKDGQTDDYELDRFEDEGNLVYYLDINNLESKNSKLSQSKPDEIYESENQESNKSNESNESKHNQSSKNERKESHKSKSDSSLKNQGNTQNEVNENEILKNNQDTSIPEEPSLKTVAKNNYLDSEITDENDQTPKNLYNFIHFNIFTDTLILLILIQTPPFH